MAELRIKFHYERGLADTGRLELYDAAIALRGVARASAIITNAYLNGGIKIRGDSVQGAKFYIDTPKRGSFVYEAAIWTAGAVASGVFYDFIKYAFTEAVGKVNLTEDYSKALARKIEPTIGELPVTLESALAEVHRPIRQDQDIVLTVTRPRGESLAVFDSETLQYLMPTTVPAPHEISGNVTKYNALTGWGRFFDLVEKRTISFNIDINSDEQEKALVTWSLHENNMRRAGLLWLRADAVVTPSGQIKRYIVRGVADAPIS